MSDTKVAVIDYEVVGGLVNDLRASADMVKVIECYNKLQDVAVNYQRGDLIIAIAGLVSRLAQQTSGEVSRADICATVMVAALELTDLPDADDLPEVATARTH